MDVIGTVMSIVELIQWVCKITKTIKRIYSDAQARVELAKAIQDKFDHEILTLMAVQDLFNSNKDDPYLSKTQLECLPTSGIRIIVDFERIISKLKVVLNKYHVFLDKYSLLEDESQSTLSSVQRHSDSEVVSLDKKKKNDEEFTKRFRDWGLHKIGSKYEFAIFGQKEIEAVLQEYAETNARLRDNFTLLCQIHTLLPKQAASVGLESFLQWRRTIIRNSMKPVPIEFNPLAGELIDLDENLVAAAGNRSVKKNFTLASFEDGFLTHHVIVECRRYNPELTLATSNRDTTAIDRLKSPLIKLAWMLHNASKSEAIKQVDKFNLPVMMKVLECKGYVDEPDDARSFLVYDVPGRIQSDEIRPMESNIETLQVIVAQKDCKPSINARLTLAYSLANTVLNLHAANWLHKNISSYSIAVIKQNYHEHGLNWIPYLGGWEAAREVSEGSRLQENIDVGHLVYLHPDRYPDRNGFVSSDNTFSAKHDLYALGVVLLEIGLWRSLSSPESSLFKKVSRRMQTTDTLPPRALFMDDHKKHINDGTLAREMGEEYVTAVLRCLNSNFLDGVDTSDGFSDIESQQDMALELQRSFRENVVDVLKQGPCVIR